MGVWLRLTVAVAVCSSAAAQTPKNIIFLIGDGMGPAHVALARQIVKPFRLGEMTVIGLVSTHSADDAVTDSGAAASALATGVKVKNDAISVDAAGKKLETALEVAERNGKATGLVTTGYFWDATVAAFASHVPDRDHFADIIRQMLRSGVDLIAGGGAERFGRDPAQPLDEFTKDSGYTILRSPKELEAPAGTPILAVFPSPERDVDHPQAALARLTAWAIDRLRNDPQGFFLIVEHEGIDSTSHENNRPELRASLRSFDAAIGVALDFARSRGDTLVLVTGDHETGSLRLSRTRRGRLLVEFATVDHTGVDVPIFAFGPGSPSFAGFLDNTDVGKKLLALVGRP